MAPATSSGRSMGSMCPALRRQLQAGVGDAAGDRPAVVGRQQQVELPPATRCRDGHTLELWAQVHVRRWPPRHPPGHRAWWLPPVSARTRGGRPAGPPGRTRRAPMARPIVPCGIRSRCVTEDALMAARTWSASARARRRGHQHQATQATGPSAPRDGRRRRPGPPCPPMEWPASTASASSRCSTTTRTSAPSRPIVNRCRAEGRRPVTAWS